MAATSSAHSDAVDSHPLFGLLLDRFIINHMIFLFDEHYRDYKLFRNQPPKRIETYIEEEHRLLGIPLTDLSYKGELYGHELKPTASSTIEPPPRFEANPTFIVGVMYKSDRIMHLTIHLAIEELPKDKAGMLHFDRNIYKKKGKYYTKSLDSHVIIHAHPLPPVPNQDDSMQFSIPTHYDEPSGLNVQEINAIIRQEIEIIIRVLNKMFDATNKNYSVRENVFPMNPLTDIILNQMNTDGLATPRGNKGIFYVPTSWRNQNVSTVNIGRYKSGKRTKKNTRSIRRTKRITMRRNRTRNQTNYPMNVVNNTIFSTETNIPHAVPHVPFEMSKNIRTEEMFLPLVPYVKPPRLTKKSAQEKVFKQKPTRTVDEWIEFQAKKKAEAKK